MGGEEIQHDVPYRLAEQVKPREGLIARAATFVDRFRLGSQTRQMARISNWVCFTPAGPVFRSCVMYVELLVY